MRRYLLLLLAIFVVACGSAEETTPEPTEAVAELPTTEPTAEPTDPPPPTNTPEPTATNTPEPTATAEPTNTPEPTLEPTAEPVGLMLDDSNRYEDEALGFAMNLPEGWVSESMMGLFTVFASSEQFMESDDSIDGAGVVLIVAPAEEESMTLEEMLEEQGELPEDAMILEGPEAIEIDGVEGVYVVTIAEEDGQTVYGEVYVFQTDTANYVMTMITSEERSAEFAPTFDAMVQSIEFSEADIEALFGGLFEEGGLIEDGFSSETIEGGILPVNTVTTVFIESGVQYTFDVEAGKSYIVAAASDIDLVMMLETATSSLEVDNHGGASVEGLLFAADSAETVQLTVAPFFGTGTAKVAIFEAQTAENSLTFDVTDGTIPIVVVEAQDSVDAVLDLSGELGNSIIGVDSGLSGDGELLVMRDYLAGTYTAEASTFGGADTTINLGVAFIDDETFGLELDLPFDGDTATDVPLPAATEMLITNSTLEGNFEAFAYSFVVEEGKSYLAIAQSEGDARILVYNNSAEMIIDHDSTGAGVAELALIDLPAGSYSLVISEFFDNEGEFELGFYERQNITTETTLAFTVAEDAPASVIVANGDGESDVLLTIYDANGDSVTTIDRGFGGDAEFIMSSELTPGEYSAEVGFFSGEGDATLSITEIDGALISE